MTQPTTEHDAGGTEGDERQRWLTLVALLAAGVVVNLDRTMVVVALEPIARDLAVGNVESVLTVNLIAFAVAAPGSGWLVTRFSPRGVFQICLAVFVAVSTLAFFTPSLGLLLVCRAIQGVTAGLMMPTTFAVIHGIFPANERPKAYALHGAVVMLSPAFGPIMGGLFADITWRLLFVVSAVGAAFATVLTLRHMPRSTAVDEAPTSLDWVGWLTAAISFPLLLVAFTMSSDWGLFSTSTMSVLALGAVTLAGFVVWELRRRSPLINLRMLKGRIFRRTIVLEWYVGIPYHVQLVVLPMSLITIAGRTPLQSGLLLTPAAIGTITIMRPASQSILKYGPRRPVAYGTVLVAASTVALTAVGATGPTALLVLSMLVLGMGAGLAMMPLTAAGLDAVDPNLVPQASAMRLLNKLLAQAVGVSIALGLVAWRLGAADVVVAASADPDRGAAAFRWLGQALTVMTVVACVLGWNLPSRRVRNATDRSREHLT